MSVGGNIRDQDSTISPSVDATGMPFYNWSVAFDEPVMDAVGVANSFENAAIIAYPNPARGSLKVNWPVEAGALKSLLLMDLSGHVVCNWPQSGASGQIQLDLGGLSRGMYWLEGESEQGVRIGCRVVLQ